MDDNDVERRVTAKVAWRFVPFLVLCYFVAYLDRVNVGFAKLTMDADIGITDTMFGFGAGVFFLAYFLLEVPSNLALDRVGARRWIARIMFSWGLISGAMAFIPAIAKATDFSGEHTFYFLRVLLGFAEAGFFPGIIFFLTLWFPAAYRARIVGYFMAAIPLSSALGSPVSASLLGLDGAARLQGLAMAVRRRGGAGARARVRHLFLPHRPAGRRALARDGRARLAGRPARRREQGARPRFAGQRPAQPLRPARARRLADLFRRRRLRSTASASGCRRSSRASACRSRRPAGSPPFPTPSASSA